jgi:hypothetical protein
LVAWLFALAATVNLLAVLIMQADPGVEPVSLAVFAVVHALVIGRVITARRFARSQRERDLQLFS